MTEQQAQELLDAAIKWQEQGSRGKWKSETSLKLWDTIERIKKEHTESPELSAEKILQVLLQRAWGYFLREWGWPRAHVG